MSLARVFQGGQTFLDGFKTLVYFSRGITAEDSLADPSLTNVFKPFSDRLKVSVGSITKRPEFLTEFSKKAEGMVLGLGHLFFSYLRI